MAKMKDTLNGDGFYNPNRDDERISGNDPYDEVQEKKYADRERLFEREHDLYLSRIAERY